MLAGFPFPQSCFFFLKQKRYQNAHKATSRKGLDTGIGPEVG